MFARFEIAHALGISSSELVARIGLLPTDSAHSAHSWINNCARTEPVLLISWLFTFCSEGFVWTAYAAY